MSLNNHRGGVFTSKYQINVEEQADIKIDNCASVSFAVDAPTGSNAKSVTEKSQRMLVLKRVSGRSSVFNMYTYISKNILGLFPLMGKNSSNEIEIIFSQEFCRTKMFRLVRVCQCESKLCANLNEKLN